MRLEGAAAGSNMMARSLGRCAITLGSGGRRDEAVASLLLDMVLWDGGTRSLPEIAGLFGSGVAGILSSCFSATYRSVVNARKEAAFGRQLDRQLAGAERVALADCMVTACELHGGLVRSGERVWRNDDDRMARLSHYTALARAFRRIHPGRLAEQFSALVSEINALASPYAAKGGLLELARLRLVDDGGDE